MYRWREMTAEQRQAVLLERQLHRLPWHGPPHYESESQHYLITAACYEHRPIIGSTPARMSDFEGNLLKVCEQSCQQLFAWVILPNHYHFLAHVPDITRLLKNLGELHGRNSFHWNGEDSERGRHVWHRAAETAIKSERHFWATLNYVLNNAVRHRYAKRWQDWPYSNAAQYLAEVGHEVAAARWREYPVLNYGDDWDPPDL
jgi:putative transposase